LTEADSKANPEPVTVPVPESEAETEAGADSETDFQGREVTIRPGRLQRDQGLAGFAATGMISTVVFMREVSDSD
jgi:hypothetical protein